MERDIIKIDEHKCTGCGLCIPGCPEGALQVIDGKARLISDLFCDGLGACIGECPEGAITVERREAVPYDEKRVMENIIRQGENVIKAHLAHLLAHNEQKLYAQALGILEEKGFDPSLYKETEEASGCAGGCPGSAVRILKEGSAESELTHWPVQMHLINPSAAHYTNSDFVFASDCSAFSAGDFHRRFMRGKTLAVACPKLDTGLEVYLEKLVRLIDEARINTMTVIVMEVPCCNGLVAIAKEALERAERKVPLKRIKLSVKGKILEEDWI